MSSRSSRQKLSTEIAKYLSTKNKASIDAKLQEGREFAKAAAEASNLGGKFGFSKFQVLTDTAGSSSMSDKDDRETVERRIFVKGKKSAARSVSDDSDEEEGAKGKQYADEALNVDNCRTAGGHPRTGIDWLDQHLEGLETWQIEEVLTITQVKPGICVAAAGALNPKALSDKGITLIVNVTKEIEPYSSSETINGNIQVVKIPVFDVPDTNLAKFMKPVARLVYANKLAGGNAVVHCVLGVSRSVTLVAAYMLFYYDMGMQRILTLIQAKRPIINPNGGFKGQLKCFEEYIKKYGRDTIIKD